MKAKLIATCFILLLFSCKKESSTTDVLLLHSYQSSSPAYEHLLLIDSVRSSEWTLNSPRQIEKLKELQSINDKIIQALSKTKTLQREDLPEAVVAFYKQITGLSDYKPSFTDIILLEGFDDTLFREAVRNDLLRAKYEIGSFYRYKYFETVIVCKMSPIK